MKKQGVSYILHVIATLDRAGTEMVCLRLVSGLADMGLKNQVVALKHAGGAIAEAFGAIAVNPVALPERRINRLRAFWMLLKRDRADAVVFHFFTLDHVLMSIIARSLGVTRIAVVQGNPAPKAAGLRRKLRLILAATRWLGIRLVSVSAYIEGTMAELGQLPRLTRVIHNGCDTAALAARAQVARADMLGDEAAILMIARMDSIKDHATLIAALARLPERIDGRLVVLNLAGDGALRDELVQQSQAFGVQARVRFLGVRSDIPELLGEAAVFCLSTTRDEGFGVVLIEALAAGTPVVASDVPACREVLADGTLGVLVSPGDPEALAQALEPALRRGSRGEPPTAAIPARYDTAVMADAYQALLGL